jgi:opacity protein-like surface antigen
MRILAALVFTFLLSAAGSAQDPKRLELTGYGGATHAGTQLGSYGHGPVFGGTMELRPFSRIGFTADVQRSNHDGSFTATFPWVHVDVKGHALDTSGGVVYHFSRTHFEPFAEGGAGVMRTSRLERDRLDEHTMVVLCFTPGCDPTPTFPASVGSWVKRDETKASFHAGGGIYIPLTSSVFLRPEFRFVGAKDVHFFHALFGIAYRR